MILVKTDAGQQTLKDRSVRLTPRQRSAFILCDGKRSIDDVLAAGMGISQEDLDHMVELGLLAQFHGMDAQVMARAGAEPAVAASRPAPVQVAQVPSAPPLGSVSPPVPAPAFFAPAPVLQVPPVQTATGRTRQQRYQDAYPIATRLTGSLGLRGFRLNLSVEGTSTYDELLALAPKIRAAVGADKAAELDRALEG